jgi:transglutaminase-like putative cysteine protease
MNDNINDYIKDSEILNYNDPNIQKKALELTHHSENQLETVKNVYEFVRDEVPHSLDIGGQMITFRASDVLDKSQGLCFAKSNLLAAMLRFLGVPTGFCYQRLTHEEGYVLHGLNAVLLDGEWYRLDARGNRRMLMPSSQWIQKNLHSQFHTMVRWITLESTQNQLNQL